MSDEQAMTIIENLSEELGEKELKIMALEKELKKTKIILGQADLWLHNLYIEDLVSSFIDVEHSRFCNSLEINEECEEEIWIEQDLFNHIMPESLAALENENYSLTVKNDTEPIIIIKRVK